jgi:hypothetical protein
VKAAGLGLLALNKVSGGAVTDIVGGAVGGIGGGLLRGAAARLPGVGSLIATPVRVVNWPAGGLGGAGGVGAAGAAGWAGSLKATASILGPAIAVAVASDFVTNETNRELGTNFTAPGAGGIGGGILTGIHNLIEVVKLIDSSLGSVRTETKSGATKTAAASRAAGIVSGLAAKNAGNRTAGATRSSLAEVKGRIDTSIGIERGILAKRRDVSVTVKPTPAYFNIDGRRMARALVGYGPTSVSGV